MADKVFKIGDNTTVPYPAEKLEDLKEVIQNQGVLTDMAEQEIATPLAIRGIADRGTGKYGIVKKLIGYVENYKSAFRA
jgi:hypothetical protein